MADAISHIQKLIELALHNPSEEEARSAAVMACRLIDKFKVPVGDMVIEPPKEYTPPSPDFMATVADIFSKAQTEDQRSQAQRNYETGGEGGPGYAGGVQIQDRELTDWPSAIRMQVVRAWRAIREARKRLEAEIYRYEQETGRRFHDKGW